MIKKEDLLKELKEALAAEENSIPVYMKHLDSAIFWTGWEDGILTKAKTIFTHLAQESSRHKIMVDNLIKHINEDKRDAF
ncbi:MAG: hypothetical protein PHT53_07830 [Candidatus Omnitrophica bacterium]|nr:hypothetical protein [Candidatus Omnitrophota bacterium]